MLSGRRQLNERRCLAARRPCRLRPQHPRDPHCRPRGPTSPCLQVLLDRSTPHALYRWLGLAALLLVYGIRVFLLQGCAAAPPPAPLCPCAAAAAAAVAVAGGLVTSSVSPHCIDSSAPLQLLHRHLRPGHLHAEPAAGLPEVPASGSLPAAGAHRRARCNAPRLQLQAPRQLGPCAVGYSRLTPSCLPVRPPSLPPPQPPGEPRAGGAHAAHQGRRGVPPLCAPPARVQVLVSERERGAAAAAAAARACVGSHSAGAGPALAAARPLSAHPLPASSRPFAPHCRWSSAKAVALGFCATFFPMFDVPVFWPILLMYW